MKSKYTSGKNTLQLLRWGAFMMAICMVISLSANAQSGASMASNHSFKSGGVTEKRPSNSSSKIDGPHIKYSILLITHTLRVDNPERIGGAEVKLYNKFKNETQLVKANADGKVVLYLEPSTTYQITVNKQGYRARFMKIEVKDLRNITSESITIMLKKERQEMF